MFCRALRTLNVCIRKFTSLRHWNIRISSNSIVLGWIQRPRMSTLSQKFSPLALWDSKWLLKKNFLCESGLDGSCHQGCREGMLASLGSSWWTSTILSKFRNSPLAVNIVESGTDDYFTDQNQCLQIPKETQACWYKGSKELVTADFEGASLPP